MIGGGAGDCAGTPGPGYALFGGRTFGRRGYAGGGRGRRGRRWRHGFYATGLPAWARCGPYAAPPACEQEAESLPQPNRTGVPDGRPRGTWGIRLANRW